MCSGIKKTSIKTEAKIACFTRSTYVFIKFTLNFVCIIKNFNTFADLFWGVLSSFLVVD